MPIVTESNSSLFDRQYSVKKLSEKFSVVNMRDASRAGKLGAALKSAFFSNRHPFMLALQSCESLGVCFLQLTKTRQSEGCYFIVFLRCFHYRSTRRINISDEGSLLCACLRICAKP